VGTVHRLTALAVGAGLLAGAFAAAAPAGGPVDMPRALRKPFLVRGPLLPAARASVTGIPVDVAAIPSAGAIAVRTVSPSEVVILEAPSLRRRFCVPLPADTGIARDPAGALPEHALWPGAGAVVYAVAGASYDLLVRVDSATGSTRSVHMTGIGASDRLYVVATDQVVVSHGGDHRVTIASGDLSKTRTVDLSSRPWTLALVGASRLAVSLHDGRAEDAALLSLPDGSMVRKFTACPIVASDDIRLAYGPPDPFRGGAMATLDDGTAVFACTVESGIASSPLTVWETGFATLRKRLEWRDAYALVTLVPRPRSHQLIALGTWVSYLIDLDRPRVEASDTCLHGAKFLPDGRHYVGAGIAASRKDPLTRLYMVDAETSYARVFEYPPNPGGMWVNVRGARPAAGFDLYGGDIYAAVPGSREVLRFVAPAD
jgi:hypothetical protein